MSDKTVYHKNVCIWFCKQDMDYIKTPPSTAKKYNKDSKLCSFYHIYISKNDILS